MKHLFVPYELAKKLKEKGFDEPCLGKYTYDKSQDIYDCLIPETGFNLKNGAVHYNQLRNYNTPFYAKERSISAPLYQQVIDWLETKYFFLRTEPQLAGSLEDFVWHYVIEGSPRICKEFPIYSDEFGSRYEALNKGIEQALNLI